MRPVFLIARNFVREQRWPLFFLLLWVLGFSVFGIFVNSESGAEDAFVIFKQLTFYGIVFAVFWGSSALNADLRSRRIMAVLSKAVSRGQYLAGLLAGTAVVLGKFCLCMGLSGSWILGGYGVDQVQLWLGILALFTACILTSALALCLSVFLPPLFAAIGSGLVSGLPLLFGQHGSELKFAIPVYALLEPLLEADFKVAFHARAAAIVIGWIETAALLFLATWIFSSRGLIAGTD